MLEDGLYCRYLLPVTTRQIIQEIETLPPEEQREVFSSLQERLQKPQTAAGEVRYADFDEAMRIADRIFTERADLFRKLAQ